MPGYRSRLSPHHQDGSSTKGNEGDNLHQTLSNRVTTVSKQQERHTSGISLVNAAIDNMKDNRVLNNRPPSINDEETLLPRRQMTTLSQLRSYKSD